MGIFLPQQIRVYPFRETMDPAFCQLYSVGRDLVTDHQYHWDGMTRADGPLFLFQYTLAGWGHILIHDKIHRVEPGDAFLVEIPSPHRYFLPETSPLWDVSFILFHPGHLAEPWLQLLRHWDSIKNIPDSSAIIRHLHSIIHAADKNRITDGYLASSYVYQFIMELFRDQDTEQAESYDWPLKVRQAADYLEAHYSSLQSLADLAEHVGLSKFYFNRLFTRHTGYSPLTYLTKVRLEQAIDRLRNTDLNVEDIALQIGYSSSSYLIRVFRQWFGCSPHEFRSRERAILY
ncbi:hypothetical protein BVG16_19825 [Paenibacillus selenitireducens]|uniref:HTH araC/xylS-type domain-containing protein n=1 Tax=Paenibacillus selenitireducens TaxID=1324314 RepID=A0A1T2X6U0_9BACL|nr:AraC family transcriptional regulator [Paenibacillus selenitireducens]OPA75594.1 hypothetical protein BVG16_19825 [Paenibacillus selenitireducens]